MYKALSLVLALAVLGAAFSGAYGIAAEYWEGRPLELSPGQSADTYFKIQNADEGAVDASIKVTLLEGSEIADITSGSDYDVSAGEQERVDVRIEVPADASIGKIYVVKALFEQASSEKGEGSLQFAFNVEREFEVIVVEQGTGELQAATTDDGNGIWIWILGILVLIGIIWAIMQMLKKK